MERIPNSGGSYGYGSVDVNIFPGFSSIYFSECTILIINNGWLLKVKVKVLYSR